MALSLGRPGRDVTRAGRADRRAVRRAPTAGTRRRFPTRTAQGFEFDDTDLFVPNRLPGYDRVDGGQRVDYGLHAGVFNPTSGSTQILVGESYRFQRNAQFPARLRPRRPPLGHRRPRGRVAERAISTCSIAPASTARTWRCGARRSGPMAADRRTSAARLSYIATSGDPRPCRRSLPARARSASASTSQLTRNWSGQMTQTQNLNQWRAPASIRRSRLTYRDDCFAVTGSIRRSGDSASATCSRASPSCSTFVFRTSATSRVQPFGCRADRHGCASDDRRLGHLRLSLYTLRRPDGMTFCLAHEMVASPWLRPRARRHLRRRRRRASPPSSTTTSSPPTISTRGSSCSCAPRASPTRRRTASSCSTASCSS